MVSNGVSKTERENTKARAVGESIRIKPQFLFSRSVVSFGFIFFFFFFFQKWKTDKTNFEEPLPVTNIHRKCLGKCFPATK